MKLIKRNLPKGWDVVSVPVLPSERPSEEKGIKVRVTLTDPLGDRFWGQAISGSAPVPVYRTGYNVALGRAMKAAGMRKWKEPDLMQILQTVEVSTPSSKPAFVPLWNLLRACEKARRNKLLLNTTRGAYRHIARHLTSILKALNPGGVK